MAQTEHCDVCNAARNETGNWWLAWKETVQPADGSAPVPMLRITGWSPILAQIPETKHVCGARCANTMVDRWMRGQ